MKSVLVVMAVVLGLALVVPFTVVAATDYSKMSNDELYQMRKQGVSPQESTNLESEWMKRVVSMTPQERQKYQVRYSDEEIQKMREQRAAPK